ncbi:hypothetical protein [Chryseosolibacter indicus]|uniref:Uncharacterized protein n=1 Tax=Chryseosolibacter indicus TaxID=2782351 RepID=A0ABS5VYF8_9BACT|nr:hypothetical protein [Chryseosolibacter indicus]MBT1705784.1 hypothetical protein [Chryseosolibacter indicus]
MLKQLPEAGEPVYSAGGLTKITFSIREENNVSVSVNLVYRFLVNNDATKRLWHSF